MSRLKRCPIDGYALLQDGGCGACTLRKAKRCMDCGEPVVGKSWRCQAHKKTAKELQHHSYLMRKGDAEVKARRRELYWRPENEERRKQRAQEKKEWRRKNQLRVALHKRRGRLDGTQGYKTRAAYLKAQRRHNRKRRESKRADARRRYYEAHPERPKPICVKCSTDIPYDGSGRPPKYCLTCSPWKKQRRPAIGIGQTAPKKSIHQGD